MSTYTCIYEYMKNISKFNLLEIIFWIKGYVYT